MFTGIVEEIGRVRSMPVGGLTIDANVVLDGMKLGDSICVNGACLTITTFDKQGFTVDTVPETLRRTNLGALRPGAWVNLERALPVDGRLGGHVVQGHVEGTAEVVSLTPDGSNGVMARFRAPDSLMRFIVAKGFIAIDGVSLTVVDCEYSTFSVTLIPFTREHTNLGKRQAGEQVNLETDVLARYVQIHHLRLDWLGGRN